MSDKQEYIKATDKPIYTLRPDAELACDDHTPDFKVECTQCMFRIIKIQTKKE